MSDLAGIYIHIPFCISKCPYCSFFSITDLSFKEPFLQALNREINLSPGKHLKFDTLYIGGGTPSIIGSNSIAEIVNNTVSAFNFASDAEITLEANPATLNKKNLKHFKNSGVNRLSIGIQSFNQENLKFLGRIHSGKDAVSAVDLAHNAGFENISIDLIYGIPGQTKKTWLNDMQQGIDMHPTHISCYTLTFEAGTNMEKRLQRKKFSPMPEAEICNLMNLTSDFLSAKGYLHYEISNYALVCGSYDYRSKHNEKYWSAVPYIGLGPSAHSFTEPVRYKNVSCVKKYIESLIKGRLPIEEKELLTRYQRMTEEVLLGFRKTDGFDMDIFNQKFKIIFSEKFYDQIKMLEKHNLLQIKKNRCRLTQKGMLYHNSIAAMLTEFE